MGYSGEKFALGERWANCQLGFSIDVLPSGVGLQQNYFVISNGDGVTR